MMYVNDSDTNTIFKSLSSCGTSGVMQLLFSYRIGCAGGEKMESGEAQ